MAVSTIDSSGLNQAGDVTLCTTSGNVGIGRTPVYTLDVNGSIRTNNTTYILGGDGSIQRSGGNAWVFLSSNLGYGSSGMHLKLDSTSGGAAYFFDNTTERASIDSSGNFKFNSGYGSSATAYGCRAWVNFNGTTASPSTIRGSGNVTSVTKNTTGDFTVNFTNAMPDANYAVAGSASNNASSGSMIMAPLSNTTAPTTTAFRFNTSNSASNLDCPYTFFCVFR